MASTIASTAASPSSIPLNSTSSNTVIPSSSSSLQECDGIRKSGPITLLGIGKKGAKTQQAYAVLSERALELHESEKAHRKKKSARSIVDLSKCFNVSQQNCPRSKAACVCLLMPDEFFMFRGENVNETTEWYGTLLSGVISARALHLGRPVFANEFFESVWDVTVCPQQPKLKRIPAPPNTTEFANSPNICAKLPELSGRKRICFYPHTIIICKVGIEPAHSGLPKSGIPPFRTVDFVEFSRHFIAQFGPVDKYFLMRIGRSSPMGSCEVWVQCDTEEGAAEITRKLQEIIQRETEKKQQALMAIRGQQQQQHQLRHGQLAGNSATAGQMPTTSCSASASLYSLSGGTAIDSASPNATERMGVEKSDSLTFTIDQQLEPISEDEALATTTIQPVTEGRKKHSSLSQSAKEKRLELRECKAKVDSLEEEEQRFQQRQMQMAQQQQMGTGWIGGGGAGKRYTAISKGSDNPDVCRTGASIVNTRPTCLMGQPTYQFRRRGSSGGTMAPEIGARSKSLSLEEQQAQCFRPFVGGGRLWTMDKADSLLLLGYGPPETEETEDSGGTLRMIPLDQEGGSQAASRSSSSLNLTTQMGGSGLGSHSSSAGQLVETYVECHVPCGINDDEEEDEEEEDEDTDSTEDEGTVGAKNKRKSRRKSEIGSKKNAAAAQRRRQKQRQLGGGGGLESGGGSLDGGAEADQSCSCSSSVASSSGHDDQQGLLMADEQNNNNNNTKKSTAHQTSGHRSQHQFDHHQSPQNNVEYTLMDKVSCSSDSFSHLAVPQNNSNNNNGSWAPLDGGRPEEICSYTSDSGDSCYSSMVNGHLNPRAFSFSSAASERAAHHFGTGKLGGGTVQQQHPAAAKWTAAMGHRNYLFHQPSAHFSPPKNHHGGSNGGNQQQTQRNPSSIQLDSSSSSRFSMETSLITPLEEDERQVTFADEEQRDRLGEAAPRSSMANCEESDDLLRKRAFSLGSKSWITKPFRKLSSAHGTPSNGRQQRSSCGGASRSGSSSLVGSMHADLCSVQEQSSQPHLASSSARLGSSSSFASSSAAGQIIDGHHTRSDSVGSSHSAALSLPGHHSQRRTTNKNQQSLEEQLKNEDLVELEFMPAGRNNGGKCISSLSNPYSNRSQQCVASLSATTPISSSSVDARNSPLRGRTNSCDDHNTMSTSISGGSYYHYQQQQQQQKAMANTMMMGTTGEHNSPFGGTPRGRGSAGALNQGGGNGGHQQNHQRLRPSESFIRSIQQQQREIQRARNQQKPRQRLKTDFPLQEVQCFIAPAERDKIDAITARDTLSLRSQRSGSGSCSQQFETIEEGQQGGTSQSRRSLTAKPATLNEEQQLEIVSGGNDESDYIIGEPPKTTAAVKA